MNTFAKVSIHEPIQTWPVCMCYTCMCAILLLILKGLVEFGFSRRTIEFHDPALAYYSLRVSLRNEATEKKRVIFYSSCVCTFAFFFFSVDNVIKDEGVDYYRVIWSNLFGYCLVQEIEKNTYVILGWWGRCITVWAAGFRNAASIWSSTCSWPWNSDRWLKSVLLKALKRFRGLNAYKAVFGTD